MLLLILCVALASAVTASLLGAVLGAALWLVLILYPLCGAIGLVLCPIVYDACRTQLTAS